jgi:hypothetical protein
MKAEGKVTKVMPRLAVKPGDRIFIDPSSLPPNRSPMKNGFFIVLISWKTI